MSPKTKLIGLSVGTLIIVAILVYSWIQSNWLGVAFNAMVLVLYSTQLGHAILDIRDSKK